jgi:hypothetical protein
VALEVPRGAPAIVDEQAIVTEENDEDDEDDEVESDEQHVDEHG